MNARAKERQARRNRRPTPGEVATALGVTRQTVRNWIARGWLTASYGTGTTAHIRLKAIERALKLPQVRAAIARGRIVP